MTDAPRSDAQRIHSTKDSTAVSWSQAVPARSLELIGATDLCLPPPGVESLVSVVAYELATKSMNTCVGMMIDVHPV